MPARIRSAPSRSADVDLCPERRRRLREEDEILEQVLLAATVAAVRPPRELELGRTEVGIDVVQSLRIVAGRQGGSLEHLVRLEKVRQCERNARRVYEIAQLAEVLTNQERR